uniref:Uncharacterized protein n=1 Tax=Rhipicephalus pulchellus TaxID=72859 RepID=L7LZ96_RHIPC
MSFSLILCFCMFLSVLVSVFLCLFLCQFLSISSSTYFFLCSFLFLCIYILCLSLLLLFSYFLSLSFSFSSCRFLPVLFPILVIALHFAQIGAFVLRAKQKMEKGTKKARAGRVIPHKMLIIFTRQTEVLLANKVDSIFTR